MWKKSHPQETAKSKIQSAVCVTVVSNHPQDALWQNWTKSMCEKQQSLCRKSLFCLQVWDWLNSRRAKRPTHLILGSLCRVGQVKGESVTWISSVCNGILRQKHQWQSEASWDCFIRQESGADFSNFSNRKLAHVFLGRVLDFQALRHWGSQKKRCENEEGQRWDVLSFCHELFKQWKVLCLWSYLRRFSLVLSKLLTFCSLGQKAICLFGFSCFRTSFLFRIWKIGLTFVIV